jgi:hypothetical protein
MRLEVESHVISKTKILLTFIEKIKNMETESRKFLNALRTYVYGDLDKFREVYIEAERKEASRRKNTSAKTSSMADTEVVTTSTTTAITTTPSIPANFDFSTQIEFRSTIPHALAVLSAIDVLGFLIGNEKGAGGTGKNIKVFLEQHVQDEQQLNLLVFIFRHGMSHSFFPKERLSISAHSSFESLDLFLVDTNGWITLNVNKLINIFKNKFDEIFMNEDIALQIEQQYQKLISNDQKKLEDLGIDLKQFASQLSPIPGH